MKIRAVCLVTVLVLMLTDAAANAVTLTNSFGDFKINDVDSGATCSVNFSAKNYDFAPQGVSLIDNILGLTSTETTKTQIPPISKNSAGFFRKM